MTDKKTDADYCASERKSLSLQEPVGGGNAMDGFSILDNIAFFSVCHHKREIVAMQQFAGFEQVANLAMVQFGAWFAEVVCDLNEFLHLMIVDANKIHFILTHFAEIVDLVVNRCAPFEFDSYDVFQS